MMISAQCCAITFIPVSFQKSTPFPRLPQARNPNSPFNCFRRRNCSGTQTGKSFRNGSRDDAFEGNGVVEEDMDVYLRSLSLEYDSVWDTKPSWCQPWTITLTGAAIVGLSWLLLTSIPVTTAAVALVGLWWYIFLYSYPKAYTEMIAERRDRVKRGLEDTYGAEIEQ